MTHWIEGLNEHSIQENLRILESSIDESISIVDTFELGKDAQIGSERIKK